VSNKNEYYTPACQKAVCFRKKENKSARRQEQVVDGRVFMVVIEAV